MRTTLISLLLAAAPAVSAADAPATSFRGQIQPILDAHCVYCHVTGAENGGLNLGRRVARASLLAASTEAPMPRVTPGDPARSYLVHKLRDTQLAAGGSGSRMPMNDPPKPLDEGQIGLILGWIEAGAPDN